MPKPQNIIAIISGNETIGKTKISLGLAENFAADGKKILLIDLDLPFGNLRDYLKISPDIDIIDVLSNKATLNQAITLYPEAGFDVILGANKNFPFLQNIPDSSFLNLKNDIWLLAGNYDLVFIDTTTAQNLKNDLFFNDANYILLLVNENAPSIRSSFSLLSDLMKQKSYSNIFIVTNLTDSLKEAEKIFLTIEKAAKTFLPKGLKYLGNVRKNHLDDILYLAKDLKKWIS